MATPFYILTSSGVSNPFLCILASICLLIFWPPWQACSECHYRFSLLFPNHYWTSFHVLFRHLCIVLGAMSLQVFLPFSNSIVFVLLSFENSLYILDISPLSNFFLLVCGLSFHPLTRVFFRTKDFNFSCCCYLVVKLCPTLWDPMYCSPPGSSVHGVSQVRILKLVAISFSSCHFLLLPDPGIILEFFVLAGTFFTTEPSGKPF